MITMTRPPTQPWPTPMPYPQPTPPPPRRARWIIPTTAGLAVLAIGAAAIIGFAAGRNTAPMNTAQPTTVTAEPQHQNFTEADSAWCREYKATTARLAAAGEDSDAPRQMAATDVPATAWTPKEADDNRRMAEQSDRWNAGLADLRATVSNPTLKNLIEASHQADTALVDKIRHASYVPADFSLYQSVNATDNALLAICDRI